MAPTPECPLSSEAKHVKQATRDWLEIPSDVMADILYRVGVIDILENAQKVCTAWRKICKEPALWRVIYMENCTGSSSHPNSHPKSRPLLEEMCNHAVDRSQGQLVDMAIVDFGNAELLHYIADRSSQLRRLEIAGCGGHMYNSWSVCLKKLPLLEELRLYETDISKEAIETAGRCCPMLKTLEVNRFARFDLPNDEIALAIVESLPHLRHLGFIGGPISNMGLQLILDACCQLESLDLRLCFEVDDKGNVVKKCSQQIKCLKRHLDSLEDRPYLSGFDAKPCVTTRRLLRIHDYCESSFDTSIHGDDDYDSMFV